jgi:hypothetical protein
MKEVFKCRDWRMMRWGEEWTKAQAWGCPRTSRNIQEVQASKLGNAPEAPLLHREKIRSPFKTLYFYCFMLYAFFLEHLYFCFQFSLVLFAAINGWTPTNFFWRRCTHFSFAKNTPFFTLIVQRVFSFSATTFSFHFFPWFLFRSCFIFASRCILTSGPCCIHQKSCFKKRFEWCWKREKVPCKKVVQKGACLDCGLGFCMSWLMLFW